MISLAEFEKRLTRHEVYGRYARSTVAWWVANVGTDRTLLLVRYGKPNLRIHGNGDVKIETRSKWHTRT